MLKIFKSFSAKTSLLDDLNFYENREKLLKANRSKQFSQIDALEHDQVKVSSPLCVIGWSFKILWMVLTF